MTDLCSLFCYFPGVNTHSPVVQVSAAVTWSLIAPSDKQSSPLLCFAGKCVHIFPCSSALCLLLLFINSWNCTGFILSESVIRAAMSEFIVDTCGGVVGLIHLIDVPAHNPSFYLTLSLCLSLCCRSVREEERPAGLWWLHLSIRRRLQRRRSSAQMRLPVPGRKRLNDLCPSPLQFCIWCFSIFFLLSTNCMKIRSDVLSVALSSMLMGSCWGCESLKTPHKYTVSWLKKAQQFQTAAHCSFYQTNRRKWCICWGLFSAVDESTFGSVDQFLSYSGPNELN